jgi:hypothetical protein
LTRHRFEFTKSQPLPEAEEFIKGFDAIAWKHLMSESGLKTFMSSCDIESWDNLIREKKTPEFNVANITSTFSKLYEDRGTMMEKGVLAVFRGLSWDYKTNTPVKFGKKIVIKGRSHDTAIANDDARGIDDLVRFMHVADGVPQPDHRNNFAFMFAYKTAVQAEEFESPYISIKGFKNGNMHVNLTRPDLVEKMNLVIAKAYPNALPCPN